MLEPLSPEEAERINLLSLAFLGDAVHTLFVRDHLLRAHPGKAVDLHHAAAGVVNAASQARTYERVFDQLPEREREILKRGRNTKNTQLAKHATAGDYRKATGFEALAGYLFLTGQQERLEWLLTQSLAEAGPEAPEDGAGSAPRAGKR